MNKEKIKCANCGKMCIPRYEFKCPVCGSTHTVSHGDIVTVKRGVLKRRKCQDCGHTFYEEVRNGGKQ